jgi:hypothetical protein
MMVPMDTLRSAQDRFVAAIGCSTSVKSSSYFVIGAARIVGAGSTFRP